MRDETARVDRRPPEVVMRLSRLGALHQCRLSFMRQLTRRLAHEGWRFERTAFEVDDSGVGHAVYSAIGPQRRYALVAFAHDLPDDQRSDRVIAEAWDATFALVDGDPDTDDIERLRRNVPVQEAGRLTEKELSLSRANRSVRLWAHVVDRLAEGRQPDPGQIAQVGYLMRTTAVYGSGKFGAADREAIAGRQELQAPFQVEMLSVYLTRWFVRDLVEHMARARGGAAAVPLADDLARMLGIGNSTGLGMAPFIINHPVLFNNWIMAREEAIARVRSIAAVTPEAVALFVDLLSRAAADVALWRTAHDGQAQRVATLRNEVALIRSRVDATGWDGPHPWDALLRWADKTLSEEGQELLCSLMLEPYPDLVDGLGACMADDNARAFVIDGAMPLAKARALIEAVFGWAQDVDWSDPAACARAWYVSEEKLEPRLGERFDEPIAAYEQPLAPARDACAALVDMADWTEGASVAEFLARHPEHRHTLRRAQISAIAPYAEIRDNTIAADLLPIDMLRAKLSFFGATRFDPRSDRWVRICMYAGAPYPPQLSPDTADLWVYPEVGA